MASTVSINRSFWVCRISFFCLMARLALALTLLPALGAASADLPAAADAKLDQTWLDWVHHPPAAVREANTRLAARADAIVCGLKAPLATGNPCSRTRATHTHLSLPRVHPHHIITAIRETTAFPRHPPLYPSPHILRPSTTLYPAPPPHAPPRNITLPTAHSHTIPCTT